MAEKQQTQRSSTTLDQIHDIDKRICLLEDCIYGNGLVEEIKQLRKEVDHLRLIINTVTVQLRFVLVILAFVGLEAFKQFLQHIVELLH